MNRLLLPVLVRWALLAAISLVLYGALPAGQLATVLALFLLIRFAYLIAEAVRPPMTLERWKALTEALERNYAALSSARQEAVAAAIGLGPGAAPRTLAEAQVRDLIRRQAPRRSKRELAVEALGAIAFIALLPAAAALWINDFFSLRTPLGWLGAAVAVVSLSSYAMPHWTMPLPRFGRWRLLWWATPFIPSLALFVGGIQLKHPYLNWFHPERDRLAAERVLALKSIVVAGRHADWVARYARHLDEHGHGEMAVACYREALRLDASNRLVRSRLAALTGSEHSALLAETNRTQSAALAPYWMPGDALAEPERVHIDSELEDLKGCSVVIVPIGEVPASVLQAIHHAVRNELRLPVFGSTRAMSLPPHTRTRGLITGRQWDAATPLQAFHSAFRPLPIAPVKYLLVTPGDIYDAGANYLFSISSDFCALVSLARLGDPAQGAALVSHRAAKQSLCALIKTFRVPPSPNRECVTSYVRSLEEFDAKGNRPAADTEQAFQRALREWNRQWLLQKAKQPGTNAARSG